MEAGPTRPGPTGLAVAIWILQLTEAWSVSRTPDSAIHDRVLDRNPYSVEVNADDLERLGRILALPVPLGDPRSSI